MKGLPGIMTVNWIKILIYGLLLLAIYYSTLSFLVLKDWQRDEFSYGPLIPFIVLYLLWIKRHYLKSIDSQGNYDVMTTESVGRQQHVDNLMDRVRQEM